MPPADANELPIDDALLAIVRCPVTGERLERHGETLRTASGRVYAILDGLPVLVPGAAQATGADSTDIA